jgi:hypothetical protein
MDEYCDFTGEKHKSKSREQKSSNRKLYKILMKPRQLWKKSRYKSRKNKMELNEHK